LCYYRAMPQGGQSPLTCISLFSGAGGLDLGAVDAGAHIAVQVEPEPDCTDTLEANARYFPNSRMIQRRIEEIETDELLDAARLRRGELALLLAGPPCQPFSKSGYWLKERRQGIADVRASLLGEFLRVLHEAKPAAFILENVAGLAHPAHRTLFEQTLEDARGAGYAVAWQLLQAAEYGVPQTRSRVFAIGLRGKTAPSMPNPSHWWQPRKGSRSGRKPPETAGRWIAAYDRPEFHEPEEALTGKWAEHARAIPMGWNYKYHTAWAGHPDPTFVTETKYWTFLLKLHPHRPAWTIQATPGSWTGPMHWSGRRLRVPELAALQTFPYRYRFCGSRRSRVKQIGNAVPCALASAVVSSVLGAVLGKKPRRGRRLRHRLTDGYSFDPSLVRHSGPRW